MIDAHTHCFPIELIKNLNWPIKNNERNWLKIVSPYNKKSIQGWSSKDEMLNSMDNSNIEKSVLLGWYWESKKSCELHNNLMKEWIDYAPSRFIAFGSIYPPETSITDLENLRKSGFKGIGELHPTIQKYYHFNKSWHNICEWCEDTKFPINIHVTEGLNINHSAYINTDFDIYLNLATKFPKLKLILAHWGGGIPFFELNSRIKKSLKNVYYDTAATPLLYEMKIFKNMINIIGSKKIIFGSDFPLKIYPKCSLDDQLSQFVKSIKSQDFSEDEKNDILLNNIKNLIN